MINNPMILADGCPPQMSLLRLKFPFMPTLLRTCTLTVMACAALVFTACSKSSDMTGPAIVNSVVAENDVTVGRDVSFVVTGSGLTQKLFVDFKDESGAAACDAFRAVQTTASQINYDCDVLKKRGKVTLTIKRFDGVVLAAQTFDAIDLTSVSSISAPDGLVYGQESKIVVLGSNLSKLVSLTANKPLIPPETAATSVCSKLVPDYSGAPDKITYTCTVNRLEEATVQVKNDLGNELNKVLLPVVQKTKLTEIRAPNGVQPNQKATFELVGEYLPTFIQLTSPSCSSFKTVSTTPTLNTYECAAVTPTDTMTVTASDTVLTQTIKADFKTIITYTITSAAPEKDTGFYYDTAAKFKLVGTNLSDTAVKPKYTKGCEGFKYDSGSGNEMLFSCTKITAPDAVIVNVLDQSGKEVDYTIPLQYQTSQMVLNSASGKLPKTGERLQYKLQGFGLKASVPVITATGCSNVKTDSTAATGRYVLFSCDVTATDKIGFKIAHPSTPATVALAKDFNVSDLTITADKQEPKFNEPIQITVGNMSAGASYRANMPKCDGTLPITAQTASTVTFTCSQLKADQAGELDIAIIDNVSNSVVQTLQLINKPKVRITVKQDTAIQGDIDVELYPLEAPNTVNNFLQYVKDTWYNPFTESGVNYTMIWHRIVTSINIIQTGGTFLGDDTKKTEKSNKSTRSAIRLESTLFTGLTHGAFTIAMARTSDPHSASAGFYFNSANNASIWDYLDDANPRYATFGKAINGTALITQIQKVEVASEKPKTPVLVTAIQRIE